MYVAQAERQGCALILAGQWPEKVGKGLIFISLNFEQAAQITIRTRLRPPEPLWRELS